MKQLTIYCSQELLHTVNQVFHKYEVEGFVHIPGIFGNKLKPKDSREQDLTWQAEAFVVFDEGNKLEGIMRDLQDFANKCDVKPCLRMVLLPIEKFF